MLLDIHVNLFLSTIGGGFGGKESRNFPLTTAVAVAAHKSVVILYDFQCTIALISQSQSPSPSNDG